MRIGEKDLLGSILILGGWKANLYRRLDGTYFSKYEDTTMFRNSPEEAIILYNQLNNTSLPNDYIEKQFEPWYSKQPQEEGITLNGSPILATFDSSSSPGDKHYVKYAPDVGLYCTCRGYGTHKHCWHIDAVQSVLDKVNK